MKWSIYVTFALQTHSMKCTIYLTFTLQTHSMTIHVTFASH